MRPLFFILFCLLSTSVYSIETTYHREYTYRASDLDSLVSSRDNALQLVKASVLEEIVTFVSTNVNTTQAQQGEDFRSSFIHRASSSSAGFLKARILDEKWNGIELWISAEIKADPEIVRKELDKSLSIAKRRQTRMPPQSQTPAPVTAPNFTTQQQAAQQIMNIQSNSITPDYSGYVLAAKISQVYALLQSVKIRLIVYYQDTGKWPESVTDIGLKESETGDGQYIEKFRIGKHGSLVALLDKQFDNDRVLSITPKSVMGGMHTRWVCNTNLAVDTLNSLSNLDCTSDKTLSY